MFFCGGSGPLLVLVGVGGSGLLKLNLSNLGTFTTLDLYVGLFASTSLYEGKYVVGFLDVTADGTDLDFSLYVVGLCVVLVGLRTTDCTVGLVGPCCTPGL